MQSFAEKLSARDTSAYSFLNHDTGRWTDWEIFGLQNSYISVTGIFQDDYTWKRKIRLNLYLRLGDSLLQVRGVILLNAFVVFSKLTSLCIKRQSARSFLFSLPTSFSTPLIIVSQIGVILDRLLFLHPIIVSSIDNCIFLFYTFSTPLVDFAYDSFQTSIDTSQNEPLYSRPC